MDAAMRQAARGALLVFGAALAFFGFVVGSGILGALGQSLLGFAFGSAVLAYGWFRLDRATRQRLALQARSFLHRTPTEH